ncbi:MAG TPA: hypothetical protein VG099_06450 [Gemmataceae bacterium]|nr:hypothetical protein [Gemmataceae bacterium]
MPAIDIYIKQCVVGNGKDTHSEDLLFTQQIELPHLLARQLGNRIYAGGLEHRAGQ